jgi:hypothetical protein
MGFKDAAKPHYLGHRERLRKLFRDAGPVALPDYELLELILPREDRRVSSSLKSQTRSIKFRPPQTRTRIESPLLLAAQPTAPVRRFGEKQEALQRNPFFARF